LASDLRKILKPRGCCLVLQDMRKSSIHIEVSLDQQNIPEQIQWHVSDNPGQLENTKSFALSFWDTESSAIMRIDLWTKDMLVGEMKRFFLQTLGGMNDTLRSATNDDSWYEEVEGTLQKLAKMLQEEESKGLN
jgi:gliding motility-associated protein GldC